MAIDDANSANPTCDFTPFPGGAYDLYIMGSDLGWGSFSRTFAGGLVIDLTSPHATLTTQSDTAVSPKLQGNVDDPNARVEVTIGGKTFQATNNGDGTWTIPAGIVGPLVLGTYDVIVKTTDLAGNTATNNYTLTIVQAPSGGGTGGQTTSNNGSLQGSNGGLANTGTDMYAAMAIAMLAILLGVGGVYRGLRSKFAR